MSARASRPTAAARRLSLWIGVTLALSLLGASAASADPTGDTTRGADVATSAGTVSFTVLAPADAIAGSPVRLRVSARSAAGAVSRSFRGTVVFTSTDPRGPALPRAYTFTRADHGTHTFGGVVLKTAGRRTITATAADLPSIAGTSRPVRVVPGPLARFAVSAPPVAKAGDPFALAVLAKDAYFNVIRSYRGTIRFRSSDPSVAALPGPYAFSAADQGVHTFPDVALTTAGSQTISVADVANARITGVVSVSVDEADGQSMYSWGWGAFGALGNGDSLDRASPVRVGASSSWTSLATGLYHVVALQADHTLWTWGSNGWGQLGDGTTTDRSVPARVGADVDWAAVSAGYDHTLAIKTDGTLWAWGRNLDGQLGTGSGVQLTVPTQVGTDADWASVSGGEGHTAALKTDGSLWLWGSGDLGQLGQLGDGTFRSRPAPARLGMSVWTSVSAGSTHTMAIRADGTLWGWGSNSRGEVGDGTDFARGAAVQVSAATDWGSVVAGLSFTAALRTDGSLWSWGLNDDGQLGDGTVVSRSSPARAGTSAWSSLALGVDHVMALAPDGTLWAWGGNEDGQLGAGTTSLNRPEPARVGSATWTLVAAGFNRTVALRS